MGLSSVIQTALSGMNAATAWVDVTADNLANAQTPGFKATTVQFATLMPQTQSLGSGSAALSGGTNPIQVGSGVEVAATSHDFSQGSIVTSEEPALLALEGEGLFILQGAGGQRSYTRQGQFALNSDGELVTPAGDRLLGFGVDAQGNLDRSQLRPLRVQVDSSTSAAHGGVSILRSYAVARDGHLVGNYSDGTNRTLGQLQLARFANPAGLAARAGNKFQATTASGLATTFDPGQSGAAEVVGGARELSNVDVGHELIELTLAGNMFQANLAVLHTADNLLGELFFPWRSR